MHREDASHGDTILSLLWTSTVALPASQAGRQLGKWQQPSWYAPPPQLPGHLPSPQVSPWVSVAPNGAACDAFTAAFLASLSSEQ